MTKFRRGDRVKIVTGQQSMRGWICTYIAPDGDRHLVSHDRYGRFSITPDGLVLVSEAPKVYHVGHDSAMEIGMEGCER